MEKPKEMNNYAMRYPEGQINGNQECKWRKYKTHEGIIKGRWNYFGLWDNRWTERIQA
jgi:hypothetical protein